MLLVCLSPAIYASRLFVTLHLRFSSVCHPKFDDGGEESENEYDFEFGGGGLGGNSDGEVSADSDGDGGDAGSSGGLVGSLLAVVPGPAEIERDDFEYPPFEGDSRLPEFHAYVIEKKKAWRKYQKKRSAANSKARALALLAADRPAASTWLPLPVTAVHDPVVGTMYNSRWLCEQFGRGYAAKLGLQSGVTVKQNHEKIDVGCRRRGCNGCLKFHLQPKLDCGSSALPRATQTRVSVIRHRLMVPQLTMNHGSAGLHTLLNRFLGW